MIRVLIVDDSPLVRRVLRELLSSDPLLQVVGEAGDGQEAIAKTRALRPNVITMDVRMPVLDGLAATEYIMAYHPTAILAISSLVSDKEVGIGFQMLGAGALDVMDKPTSLQGNDLERLRKELIQRVKLLARVRVVTHLRGRRVRNPPTLPAARPVARPVAGQPLLVIGASTGGPKALQLLLQALPAQLPVPVVIVQHIAEGFVNGMVDWLAQTCKQPVSMGQHNQQLRPGEVIVAPSGTQLLVDSDRRVVLSKHPATSQCPSIDVTMHSVADSIGRHAIGVLLTGMGRDGAAGMAAIRAAGGHTIAQDEASSAIFGMPKAAIELGAVAEVLPLEQIPAAVLTRLAQEQQSAKRSG